MSAAICAATGQELAWRQTTEVAPQMLPDRCMMDVAISLLAFIAGGVSIELFAAARAPLGYQDENGFHLGVEPRERADELQSGNAS